MHICPLLANTVILQPSRLTFKSKTISSSMS